MTTTVSSTLSPPRRLAAGLAAVLIAVLAGGCSSGSDGPDVSAVSASPTSAPPSPPPTLDAEVAIEAASIETAKTLIVDYLHAFNEVGAAAGAGWESLLPFWGGDYSESMVNYYTERSDDGLRSEGFAAVVSQEVVEYTPSSGGRESVTLDSCVDFSDVRGFNADGSEIDFSGSNRRYISRYVVQHEQGDHWTIHSEDPAPERPC